MGLSIDYDYVKKVYTTLSSNPTSQDLDFLLEAYNKMGYFVACAVGDADAEDAKLDYDIAVAKDEMRRSSMDKVTVATLDAHAVIKTYDQRKAAIKSRTDARKLMNLYQSIEQAINAVKYLGRMDNSVRIGP